MENQSTQITQEIYTQGAYSHLHNLQTYNIQTGICTICIYSTVTWYVGDNPPWNWGVLSRAPR